MKKIIAILALMLIGLTACKKTKCSCGTITAGSAEETPKGYVNSELSVENNCSNNEKVFSVDEGTFKNYDIDDPNPVFCDPDKNTW